MSQKKTRVTRDVVEARRELVAELAARRLTQRAIVRALNKNVDNARRAGKLPPGGSYNPVTNNYWCLATINKDLQAIRKKWHENAQASIEKMREQQLAEISAVIRAAWSNNDLRTVLSALKLQAELFGLDAPLRINIEKEIEKIGLDYDTAFNQFVEMIASGMQNAD